MNPIVPLAAIALGGFGLYEYDKAQKAKKATPRLNTPGDNYTGGLPDKGIALTLPYTALNDETIGALMALAAFTKTGEATVWLTPEAQKDPEAVQYALSLALKTGESALIRQLQDLLDSLGGVPNPGEGPVDQPQGIQLDHLPNGQTILFWPLVQDELHRMTDQDGKHFVWMVANSRSVPTLNAAAEFFQFSGFPNAGDYLRSLRQVLVLAGQTGEWDMTATTDPRTAYELAWQRMMGIRP